MSGHGPAGPVSGVNAVSEFAALWASRPGLDASVEQTSAWYRAKGELHEWLAGQAERRGDVAEQATEQGYALAAHEHACALLIEAEEAEAARRPVAVSGGVSGSGAVALTCPGCGGEVRRAGGTWVHLDGSPVCPRRGRLVVGAAVSAS